MTPTDTVVSEERLREILDGCEGVTPGPYEVEEIGNRDDGIGKFTSYEVTGLVGAGSRRSIIDTLNSGSMSIEVEYDEDGHSAWDKQGERDTAHIARLDPATVASMARELLDRRTATPQSGGVVVKGLEWAKNGPASLWTGELIFGVYYVADEARARWRVVRGQFLSEAGMTEIAFGSLDTVKAAAQADYEAHIRSTLADPIPEAPADEEVEAELRRQADAAYIRYINLMGTKPCLGVEAKLASGEFGAANLDAHREASEALGRHRGINAAIDILRAIRRSTETDKPGVREALEALRPFAEAFAKADDPGVSDLYNEQPFSLHVPLGAWRRARSVWRRLSAPLPRSSTGGAK